MVILFHHSGYILSHAINNDSYLYYFFPYYLNALRRMSEV